MSPRLDKLERFYAQMSPSPNLSLLNRGTVPDAAQDKPTWKVDASSRREQKSMSKAERLLGVSDTTTMKPQRAEPTKKPKRVRGLSNAFTELKGAISGKSKLTVGRKSPPSPVPFNGDSDSMATSVASPLFDSATSSSTVPSFYDNPSSPYHSNKDSSVPASPDEANDSRADYHTAINPTRYKAAYETDMPSINEDEDKEKKDSSRGSKATETQSQVTPTPSPPKATSSSSPINGLRSPSTLSANTEVTAKPKLFGWKNGKLASKEIFEPQVAAPTPGEKFLETRQENAYRYEDPSQKDRSAVEDWLARADLDRRPSMAESTYTRTTISRAIRDSKYPASISEVSAAEGQKEDAIEAALNKLTAPLPLRRTRSSIELNSAQQAELKRITEAKMLQGSYLDLSGSEDEGSDDETPKPRSRARSADKNLHNSTMFKWENSSVGSSNLQRSQSTNTPSHSSPFYYRSSSSSGQDRDRLRTYSMFSAAEWQSNDTTELGRVAMAAAEKAYVKKTGLDPLQISRSRSTGRSHALPSPTNKLMLVSQREEMFLTAAREKNMKHPRSSALASGSKNHNAASSPQKKKRHFVASEPAEDMSTLDENEAMEFPPAPSRSSMDQRRPSSLAYSMSSISYSDSDLPEVVRQAEEASRPPVPPILLSPSILSKVGSSFTVSEVTASLSDGLLSPERARSVPPPSELQGSSPGAARAAENSTPAAARTRPRKSRSRRSTMSTGPVHITGLEESVRYDEDEGFGADDDLAEFVRSACI